MAKALQYGNNILKGSGVLVHSSTPTFQAPSLSSSTYNTLVFTIQNGWLPTIVSVRDENNVYDVYYLATNYVGWWGEQDVSCVLIGTTIRIQTQATIHANGVRFYNYVHMTYPGYNIASVSGGIATVNSRAVVTSKLMFSGETKEADCINVIPYNADHVEEIIRSTYIAKNNFSNTRFITGYEYEPQAETNYYALLSTESADALLTTSNYVLTGATDMSPTVFNPKRWQLIAGITSQMTIDYQYPPTDKDSGIAEDAIESGIIVAYQPDFLLFADVDGAPQWVAPSNINP